MQDVNLPHTFFCVRVRTATKSYTLSIAARKGEKAQLIFEAIRRQPGPIRLADVEQACPGVGRDWIRFISLLSADYADCADGGVETEELRNCGSLRLLICDHLRNLRTVRHNSQQPTLCDLRASARDQIPVRTDSGMPHGEPPSVGLSHRILLPYQSAQGACIPEESELLTQ